MRRSLLIVIAIALASVSIFLFAYHASRHICKRYIAQNIDDLTWLQLEFRLSATELARIRQLHEGYLPKCRYYCAQIAAKQRELETLTVAGTNAIAAVEQKLAEIAALRAQCQAEMLRHFTEVSRAMPPEQGRRYLAEMQRLTLGQHEQTERSMSQGTTTSHGHH